MSILHVYRITVGAIFYNNTIVKDLKRRILYSSRKDIGEINRLEFIRVITPSTRSSTMQRKSMRFWTVRPLCTLTRDKRFSGWFLESLLQSINPSCTTIGIVTQRNFILFG